MTTLTLFAVALVGTIPPGQAATPIYPNIVNAGVDPLFANLTIPATAASAGMWLSTQSWPIVGIHSTVMPDGRVLTYGTPQGMGIQDGRTLDIWSPSLGFSPASHLTIANGQAVDSFCGTAATLPQTGDVILSGGGSFSDGYNSFASTIVTPTLATATSSNFSLNLQRWYATMITLADGRQLIGGGGTPYSIVSAYGVADLANLVGSVTSTPEVFTPGTGWVRLNGSTSLDAFGANNNHGWYPRMWVAPDATVFGISTEKMWNLDPVRDTIQTVGDFKTTVNTTTLPNVGPTSTAVMYDIGKILQVGGNGYNNTDNTPSSRYATTFDINAPKTPVVKETAPMSVGRQWANSLVLPDGNVLITGGSTFGDTGGGNVVLPAEIWNPATGKWTIGASAANYRGYHSTTALLPDGAVLSTGGGIPGPVENLNVEIYYPPYLFPIAATGSALAARPQVVSFNNATANYGTSVSLQMSDAGPIASASLIGLSSTTHSFNTFQRRIPVPVRQSGTQLSVTLPPAAAIAPPGYYLLTVLNAAGVPSRGIIIALNAAAVPQMDVTALLPTDNTVRSIQLLAKPGNVIRHANFAAWLNPLTPQSNGFARDDAAFYARPGNANSKCYSFESRNFPNYFLRHQNFRVYLQPKDGSSLYAADSTFCAVAGLSGSGFSLQSLNFPGTVMHVRGGTDIGIDAPDGTDTFNQAATFNFSELQLPNDGKLHALSRLSAPFWMVRHQSFFGSISAINSASMPADRADASFYFRVGNANPGCYSIEASNFPGYFLRQNNFRIQLVQKDGSASFNNDSTFCLEAGLAGAGFSLRSSNFPTMYLNMHSDFGLYLSANDNSAAFAGNATFGLSPAP